MMESNYISYKDSSARVFKKDKLFYRYVFIEYKNEFDHLINSGLYDELVKKELLIEHEEIIESETLPNVYKVILPKQIAFQSYPFEWSFRQWKKTLIAFLTINQIALKYGMILKDATPFNFYIKSDKALLFDTTSFTFFNNNDQWQSYKQFCESFLSPFALVYYNGPIWSKLFMSEFNGLPLKFVSKQLPIKSWFNITVLLHIHLHSKYVNKTIEKNQNDLSRTGFTYEKMRSILSTIKETVNSWEFPHNSKSLWDSYYYTDIESRAYISSKEEAIKEWLKLIRPLTVLDLGANIGKFSILSSKFAERVIALESDEACVDKIDESITRYNAREVYPLVCDISSPSPSLGIFNEELTSLLHRVNSELVLSLALIHHLFFTKHMSFELIAQLFSRLASKYLILEFIPNDDRKVIGLIKTYPQKSPYYTLDFLQSSFSKYFELIATKKLESSSRILILYKKFNSQ